MDLETEREAVPDLKVGDLRVAHLRQHLEERVDLGPEGEILRAEGLVRDVLAQHLDGPRPAQAAHDRLALGKSQAGDTSPADALQQGEQPLLRDGERKPGRVRRGLKRLLP